MRWRIEVDRIAPHERAKHLGLPRILSLHAQQSDGDDSWQLSVARRMVHLAVYPVEERKQEGKETIEDSLEGRRVTAEADTANRDDDVTGRNLRQDRASFVADDALAW